MVYYPIYYANKSIDRSFFSCDESAGWIVTFGFKDVIHESVEYWNILPLHVDKC